MAEWTQARIDRALALLTDAAIKRARCPMSHPHGPLDSGAIEQLIELGLIRSEVSGRNYRQVFILAGQHKGKSTAPNPHGHAPWRIDGREQGGSRERRVARQSRDLTEPKRPKAPRTSRFYQSRFEPS